MYVFVAWYGWILRISAVPEPMGSSTNEMSLLPGRLDPPTERLAASGRDRRSRGRRGMTLIMLHPWTT
jgi:hypothetical protein